MSGQLLPESAGVGHTFKLFFMTIRLLQSVSKVIANQKKHDSRG